MISYWEYKTKARYHSKPARSYFYEALLGVELFDSVRWPEPEDVDQNIWSDVHHHVGEALQRHQLEGDGVCPHIYTDRQKTYLDENVEKDWGFCLFDFLVFSPANFKYLSIGHSSVRQIGIERPEYDITEDTPR